MSYRNLRDLVPISGESVCEREGKCLAAAVEARPSG